MQQDHFMEKKQIASNSALIETVFESFLPISINEVNQS